MNIDPFHQLHMGSVRDGWIMHILWHLKTYLRKSTEKLKIVYENGAEITDLSVSFDGTWLTRGHTSLIGVGCVIDMLTGYVVDFEVMRTALRSTVKDCRAQGISLGGKAHGSLKEATIKKLTTYYQRLF
ncbi:uncharacterized protein TNCV_2123601 [Trichonephila clavipes]|nr:uncharacterized protein TNCV_2123601 [Trichonephila clavipes]